MNDQRDFMAYLNGLILPYSQVVAELQEADAQSAGGFYDAERTFGGKVFKLRNHLERLYNGLNFSQINPGLMGGRAGSPVERKASQANKPRAATAGSVQASLTRERITVRGKGGVTCAQLPHCPDING